MRKKRYLEKSEVFEQEKEFINITDWIWLRFKKGWII